MKNNLIVILLVVQVLILGGVFWLIASGKMVLVSSLPPVPLESLMKEKIEPTVTLAPTPTIELVSENLPAPPEMSDPDWTYYYDKEGSYSIMYPKGWTVGTYTRNSTGLVWDNGYVSVSRKEPRFGLFRGFGVKSPDGVEWIFGYPMYKSDLEGKQCGDGAEYVLAGKLLGSETNEGIEPVMSGPMTILYHEGVVKSTWSKAGSTFLVRFMNQGNECKALFGCSDIDDESGMGLYGCYSLTYAGKGIERQMKTLDMITASLRTNQ